MLSVQRVKELLKEENVNVSDKEAEEIRDSFHELAEIIFEKWKIDRKTGRDLNKIKKIRYSRKYKTNL